MRVLFSPVFHRGEETLFKENLLEGMSAVVMDEVRPKFKRSVRRESDANQIEYELWLKYKKKAGTIECRETLTELLDRHDGLLRKLACRMAVTYCRSGTFDDHLQNLRIGAIRGYDKYQPDKGTSVSTFASEIASKYALDVARKNQRPISVSSHVLTEARAIRSYFEGELESDPEAKTKFELDHDLTSSEKIAIALQKYQMLSPIFLPLEQQHVDGTQQAESPDQSALTENEIIQKLDFERAKTRLSERANQVLRMSVEEQFTDREVAEALNITTSKVRVDLRKMKGCLGPILQEYS